MAQSLSGIIAGDEVMKGSLASYTWYMEIASYTILIAAAKSLDETEGAHVCEENLREEVAMADWLKNHLPATTKQFFTRADTESENAKR
ncbi:DUF892 family protein [Mesorhizobium sp. M0276]|uniref:DUF892 family protein n=1 Tax=Mesorhizobium sp. M0276 TaxID=2956928 RepID=UPI00333B2B7F